MLLTIQKAVYRFCRWLVWVFYPRITVEGAENLPEGPCLAVGNHAQMNGPITSVLYYPRKRKTWCAGQMMKLNNVLGFSTLLIAHITFNLPYVILSVMPKLGQLDPNLLDAALDLGCTPVQAFFKVIIHEIMPGILSGALMAFTMSLDDFVISYFVYGPGFVTLPVEIYNYTKKPLQPKIYALFTLLFLAILLVMVVMNLVQAGDERRRRQARGVFGKKGASA